MQPTDDSALLRQFAEDQSDEAFAALVTRHVNLVYSVALRRAGNPHHAEEITQAVFIILARKAGQLRHDKALSSWLFQATRLTANNFVRSEMRRHHREQEAFMQSLLDDSGSETWPRIAPLLDEAVAGLREKDRRAIVLRFYEGRNIQEVGQALGASEAAAEKRVSRALEKLRKMFTKRGVTLSAVAIAGAVTANSVSAAPMGLAVTVTAAAAKGAVAGGSTLALAKGVLKLMAWTKAKAVIIGGVVVLLAAGTATVVVERQIAARQYVAADQPWADAGAATPRAALESLAWALTHDKVDRAQELVQWDEKGVENAGDVSIMHQMALAGVLAPYLQNLRSFRILSVTPTQQPDEVIVKIEETFNDRRAPMAVTAKLRRSGSLWRAVGNQEYAKGGGGSMKLPFSGSF